MITSYCYRIADLLRILQNKQTFTFQELNNYGQSANFCKNTICRTIKKLSP